MGIKDVDSKVSEKDIESANTVSDMNLFVRENSERDHWEDGILAVSLSELSDGRRRSQRSKVDL